MPVESWTDQIAAVRAGRASEVRVSKSIVTSKQWQSLAEGCESLEVLDVETLSTDSDPFALLSELPRLRHLRIGSLVNDADLQRIAAISSLRVLNLPRGDLTDDGLRALTALLDLELLRFHSRHVSDVGMTIIASLPSLRFLHLINVPISDAGLTPLANLDRLESLYLDGCNCTDEGILRLLESQPQLHVHRDQLHVPNDPQAHKP